MRTTGAGGLFVGVLAGLGWIGLAAQQTQPFPGPGSGVVTISGGVDVRNTPSVNAAQRGEWKVAIDNAPDVRIANTPNVALTAPDFLSKGGRYQLTWPNGDREVVTIASGGSAGWVRLETTGRRRWINIAALRSVEDVP
jgi:hypothetical protein